MTAPHDLTALEQRDALRGGDISSKELTEHYLARIDRYDEQLGAFVEVTADLARVEAAKADDALHAGDHSPLLGMPIAFKDLHFVAGVPITMGSTAIDPMVMPVDAWTVGLLRRAGSVTLGTTHAPEFGAPCYTHSDVVGRPAITPYDTTRYAAGSSGGAAAAVAAGLLPAAHGSDGAGSIRLPAAACGLVGLKPTRGRVSTAPLPSFQSWTTEGPLARTVADAGLLLDVMANPPAGELHRRGIEQDESFVDAALSAPIRPVKIAVWTDNGLVQPTAEIAAAVEHVARTLGDGGHEVTVIANPVPWTDHLVETFFAVFSGLAASLVESTIPTGRRANLQDITRWLFELGQSRSAAQHVAATDALAEVAATLLAAVEPYDAVLTPVTTSPAVPVGYFHADGIDHCATRMLEWAAYCPMQNWTGQPAIALPTHVSGDGLPIAVQLTAARHGDDALLLSLGRQLEDAFDWAQRHPPQWSEVSQ